MTEPVLAEGIEDSDQPSNFFSATIEDDTVLLSPKINYVLELESDIDINETDKDDEIYFRLVSKVQASNGMFLPEHTRFAGRFKKIKKVNLFLKGQEHTL